MFPSSSSQTSLYGPLGFSDVSFGSQQFSSQSLSDSSLAASERNPQDEFKHNIHVVQQHLARIQGLARSVLSGIEHAYQPGTNPIQTATEAESLKQMLHELAEFLKQTGVGALPLLDPASPLAALPTEEKLLEDTTKSIEAEYVKHQRMQESAATVVNLLTALDQSLRK
ncbi:uncharacterized protein PHACADRAFT_185758 [Phanerochaete carnosa HHB-10118-sp]|uniref:Uncharacterized protein n=1 Tax=Phanerochaete carnosa (strain HHB-10118-sp) TaxID=650164 RepID=K5W221_PHACS|nr:uncharacterized protein PHACADRAFT_185758 [Phanerochaete carnosa HHB-10118-sp]EKM52934.1 hypothetical protein PHACADRAFT_185758 [Phanerochaete carnosa HHB-10118-sp]